MKVTTAKPYDLMEVAAMNNKRGLYESEIGLVRIINASPDQEIEVDFTLYETDRKRFWGMKNVTGEPYQCLAFRIKEK